MMLKAAWTVLSWALVVSSVHAEVWSLQSPYEGDAIVLTASTRTAGAISSIRWKGFEFLDAADHGRELQSAVHFDGLGECYNPTEAGSERDGTGQTSTSRLLSLERGQRTQRTRTLMAFWLAPGKKSPDCSAGASNESELSDYELDKRVSLDGITIWSEAVYRLPRSHRSATFEALTAYMPSSFSVFWAFDPSTGMSSRVGDGPGEQPLPLIFATADGSRALGVYSPMAGVQYGRWRFAHERVNKWNCVFRRAAVEPGAYTYRCAALVGSLSSVEAKMKGLHELYVEKP